MKNNNGLRYVAYIRKSEERTERQELSHPAQKRKIEEQFPDLNIVEWIYESKSAFKPGREEINRAIQLLKSGEIDGIVSWHPNRVSRNEIDAATITYMLRTKELKDLKFCAYTFENTPEGIMMLQIIMSQSQYESAKQGRDVSKGMKEKAIKGERPGIVPTGYMKMPILDAHGVPVKKKDKIVTQTVQDPERIDMVKKMWKMLLSGVHTAPQIRLIANEEWGFTLRKPHQDALIGGGPIGYSSIYRMFNNPFYTGYIMHNGELYKGQHEAIISLDDFDYAQKLMGSRGKPRTGTTGYAYTELIKCGVCGCAVNGKTKYKFVKSENKMVAYAYYHCIRKSDKRPCNQSIYTKLGSLEQQIDAELAKYTILPEFRGLALKILNRNHKVEVKDRSKIYEMQQKKRKQVQAQLDGLVDMRTRNLLDDEEYTQQRSRIKNELMRMDQELRSTEGRAENWLQLTEKAFNFATYARVKFQNGNLATKRDILMTLGTNLQLKDQQLTLEQSEWLIPIGIGYPELEKQYLSKVRTNQKATPQDREMALAEIINTWRARWDSNPRHAA